MRRSVSFMDLTLPSAGGSGHHGHQGSTVNSKAPGGLPDGSLVRNPPASAGGTGLIPDPERSHVPWSNRAHKL